MNKLLLLLCLLPAPASAAEGDEAPEFHVLVNPDIYDPKAFKTQGVAVGTLPKSGNHPNALPSLEKREAVFQKVPGLEAAIARMDEMDRDLLYQRAGTKPLKDLKKIYPKLSEKILARLKKERAAK